MALVIDSFKFSPEATDDYILDIQARYEGWRETIMKFLNLNERAYLKITKTEIEINTSGFDGNSYFIAPFNTITSMSTAVYKPYNLFILGLVMVFGAVGMLLMEIIGSVVAILIFLAGLSLIVLYYFSKALVIGFSTGDITATVGLTLKSGMVSGQKVDHETFLEVIEHVNVLLIDRHAPLTIE